MPRKILIVDDSAINRLLLQNVLRQDYETLEAENGEVALDILHQEYHSISAVLLDIVMPKMGGYALLQRMRDDVRLSDIPVIMVTGSEDEASRVKALTLGANDFILKPFNPEIVKHCLKNNIALHETATVLNAIQKDKLTSCYNREAFLLKVGAMIAQHEPGYYILSCFDIDNFKLINDQYGAAVGDRLLREIGKALWDNAEELDGIAGRISSDNFAALFPAAKKATSVLQRILDKSLVALDRKTISFSIGRYIVNDLSLPASAIYDRAFIAKQSVKGRYDVHLAYFDNTMLEKLVRDQQITGEMETALQERQFKAWFQPQYNHDTGALLGAEALVRWQHPEKGVIPPGDFIPLFEQNGFIYELDKHVWRETCRYMRRWLDLGYAKLPISVNISRYDIFRADLIDVLTGLIAEYAIPVELLRLEITESAFTASSAEIVGIVRKLIGLGFTVEIDDFGSGYSSLNTLKNVPAQVVKLDMRFLDGGEDARRGGNILESIVRMTKWLGMTVLAEGVEELEQADFLKSIGCTYIQGYLYARPMPAEAFEELLSRLDTAQPPFVPETIPFDDAFWDPKSIDSVVFNKYSGSACVYEFHNGRVEMIRVSDTYLQTVFGPGMTVDDVMQIDWNKHADAKTLSAIADATQASVRTREESTGDYLFINLPGCSYETWLRSTLRVIASADDRHLVYCTSINITAQQEAARKSAALAGKLAVVMDNVGCGITAVTYENGIAEYRMVNERYYGLLGYTPEQHAELDGIFPIYEEDREWVETAVKQAYAANRPVTLEFRANKRDGSTIWVRDTITVARIPGIADPMQLSILYDITAERQASRELLDNLPCGTALFANDGKRLHMLHSNRRFWELMGRAPMDGARLSILDYVQAEDRLVIGQEISSAIEQGRDVSCDIRVLYGRDEYRPFHIAGRIVKKETGRHFIYVVFSPITDAAMSLQEMLPIALQAVMDSSSEISYVKSKDMRYISCSRQFALLAGRSDEKELIGKNAFDVFPPELAARYESDDRSALESGLSLVDVDYLFPKGNAMRHLLFSKYPLLDTEGNILGVYGTGRDVTAAREAESRLQLLTNNIPGGVAVYEGDPKTLRSIRLTYFSDGFHRLFGYTREEYEQLAAVDPLGRLFSADVSGLPERITALIQAGVPMDCILRARTKEGETKRVNIKAVLGEQNGEAQTLYVLLLDVTEQETMQEQLRVSEEINRLALQQGKNAVCRYDVAAKRLVTSSNVNPIFGIAPVEEDVPDRMLREGRISPGSIDAYTAFYESIRRGDPSGEVLFQRDSTLGWRWVEQHFTTIFSDDGLPATAVISFNDVTEAIVRDAAYQKWMQSFHDRAPDSYSLFHCNISRNAVLAATEGLLIPAGASGSIDDFDLRTEEYAAQCVFDVDRTRFLSAMRRESLLYRFAREQRTTMLEYREKLPGDSIRWLRLTIDLVDSTYTDDVEAYLLFENIDKAKNAELDILVRAETDPLTGVLNRTAFAAKADEIIRASGPHARHALLMLDLDGFKLVNDTFGHGMGDDVLIDIASLLRTGSRGSDLVGRLGGDEFVVFLADIPTKESAGEKARQICKLTRRVLSIEVQISGSVGVALYPQDGDCFETLYRSADATLYYVKDAGKNSYAFSGGEPVGNRAKQRYDVLKPRMLIVDDSSVDCEMLANLFRHDFQVEKAKDGNAALVKLHHFGSAIAIVLLDLMMPGIDGFAVLKKMQQNANMKSVPVVVVSGSEENETGLKAIRMGAADFVTKPIDPDILRIRVLSAISKSENERLRAQSSFLELQSNEMNSYRALLERCGMLVIIHDWVKGVFSYDPSVSRHLSGTYDERTLWRILLSDLVTDSQTVQRMQRLVHDVANDRNRMDGQDMVTLKTLSGEKHVFSLRVYKQPNEFGLTDKLILTLQDTDAPGPIESPDAET